MPRLGPRQQSVVIAAATVLLLLLTLILINADSIRSSKVVQRLSRTKQGSAGLSFSHQLQGLRSSLLSTQPSSRKLTVAGTSGTSEERGDHETDPRALDYSRLRQLPEKEPIDTASLGGGVITWMQEAEDMIVAEIEKVQFPASCSEAKWLAVPMHMGGLMSDVHLFQASLVFGVSHGYTVVPLPNSHLVAFAGCIEKSLHCFFQPVTNCSFYDSPRRVAFYREASIGAPRFPAGRRRGAFAEREIPEALARGEMPGDVIAVPIWPFYYGEPVQKDWFDSLFERLKARGSIQIHGPESHSHKEFMLYSVLSKWTMRPLERIQHLANRIVAQFPDVRGPVLGLQVRQTDKTKEDPFFVANGRYRTADELFQGLEKWGPRWKSVFLMSDSQMFLEQVVANPASLHLGADVNILYNRVLNRSVMEGGGHNLVAGPAATEQTDHFVAGLYVMTKLADFAVATFSSNVGRGILELLAAERRITQVDQVGPLADGVDQSWGTHH